MWVPQQPVSACSLVHTPLWSFRHDSLFSLLSPIAWRSIKNISWKSLTAQNLFSFLSTHSVYNTEPTYTIGLYINMYEGVSGAIWSRSMGAAQFSCLLIFWQLNKTPHRPPPFLCGPFFPIASITPWALFNAYAISWFCARVTDKVLSHFFFLSFWGETVWHGSRR